MTPQPQAQYGANRRRDFRCPMAEPGEAATLRAGQTDIPVWILDESAGGFAVRAYPPLNLHVDDLVELSTPAGVFEVRVANLNEEPPAPTTDLPPETADQQDAVENAPPSVRLGLQHVRDVGFWVEMPSQTPWYKMLRSIRVPLPVNWDAPTVIIGIVLTLCVVVPLVVFTWYGEEGTRRLMRKSLPAKNPSRAVEPIAPSDSIADRTPPRSGGSLPFRINLRPAINGVAHAIDGEMAGRTVRDLAGATPFELPDVIRMLSLSDTQQAAIREIVDTSSHLLQNLDALAPSMSRQERTEKRDALLNEARRQAEEVLNPEQRAQWTALENGGNADQQK